MSYNTLSILSCLHNSFAARYSCISVSGNIKTSFVSLRMRFSKNNKLKLDKTICVILPFIPSKIVYSSSFVIESSRPISITNAIFSSTRCIRIAKLFLSHCLLSYFSIALRIFFSTNCSNIWPIFLQSTFSF